MALQKPQAPWLTPQPGEQVLRVLGKLDPTAHGIAALGELGMGALGAEHMGAHALTPAVPAIAGLMIARRLSDAKLKRRCINR